MEHLAEAFDTYITDEDIVTPQPQRTFSSLKYDTGKVYFVKVFLRRNVISHRLATHWKNIAFRLTNNYPPFKAVRTPTELAKQEYENASELYEQSGITPKPHEYVSFDNRGGAAILYEYVPNTGYIDEDQKSIADFDHIAEGLSLYHETGHIHGSIADSIIKTTPTEEPYLIDPTQQPKSPEYARQLAIGYDLASLIVAFAESVGTLPAVEALTDYYDNIHLVSAYATAPTTQIAASKISPRMVNHVRSSIQDTVHPDAIDEYRTIVEDETDSTATASISPRKRNA